MIPINWLYVGILTTGITVGGYGMKVWKDNDILSLQNEHTQLINQQQADHLEAIAERDKMEAILSRWLDEAAAKLDQERKKHEKTVADLRAELKRLRDAGPITIPSRPVDTDTLSSCRHRAAVLGDLLKESTGLLLEGADLATELGDDSELIAIDLRAMIEYTKKVREVTQ